MMTNHLAAKVSKFAGTLISNPPRRYAAAFFICIPTFAFVYSSIPRGFYQSTIRIENTYSEQATRILSRLCSAVATSLPAATRLDKSVSDQMQFSQSIGPWSFTPRTDLTCDRLRIADDDQLRFTLTVNLRKTPLCKNPSAYCYDILDIPFVATIEPLQVKSSVVEMREFVPIDEPGTARLEFAHPIEVHAGKFPPLLPEADKVVLKDVMGVLFGEKFIDQDYSIILNGAFEQEIASFLLASSGFTSEANGHFWRMLYFSAVTISTLGYGDIVPVAPLGRALVTLEVILGLLFAGLFLNSLKARG
jgi:hypothetical protein